MRNVFLLLFSTFIIGGCSTLEIPKYIKDENPYEQVFYAPFDEVLTASSEALEGMGWKITETANPIVFEHNAAFDPTRQQIILFTNVRQMGMVVGSSYQRVNLILRSSGENMTNAEIRYVTVSTATYKAFYSYKKDAYVEQIFNAIQAKLN